jgi:hypothetical protein
MKWTYPYPPLFVRFARSPGKPIACLSELTLGLRALPCGRRGGEPRQNARQCTKFPFVKNFVAGAAMK